MIVFETDRLFVRHLRDDDFKEFYNICSDPEIMCYMDDGTPLSVEQTRSWIKLSQENYQRRGYGCFAIIFRENGQLIGFGGLTNPQIEIIYAFKSSYWGQGLASEFVRAMLKTSFERWELPDIEASIDQRNLASIKVVEKVGMTFVRSDVDLNGQPTLWYALNRPVSDKETGA